jgi:quinol monooxygenase YgiN
MPEVLLIAHHTIAPGEEDAVYALLPRITEAVRTEPGNLTFDAYRKLDEPRSYVLLERYASRRALADHRETPHYHELVLGELVPRLEARRLETLVDAPEEG